METTCGSLLVSFPASMFVLFSVNDLGGDGVGVSVNVVILGVVERKSGGRQTLGGRIQERQVCQAARVLPDGSRHDRPHRIREGSTNHRSSKTARRQELGGGGGKH